MLTDNNITTAATPLTAQGSSRQYFRIAAADGTTTIRCVGTSREENAAFIHIARHLESHGLPVPHVLDVAPDGMSYTQTDAGRRSLYDAIAAGREAGGRYSDAEQQLLHRTVAQLPRLQLLGAIGMDYSVCYPQAEMDEQCVHFDLDYFKYCFLKTTGTDFHELRLHADACAMARDIAADTAAPPTLWSPWAEGQLLYRDFQARNVMLADDGALTFIDFQGARRGPVHYDLVSFLYQASARYPDSLRTALTQTYLDSFRHTVEQLQPQAATAAAGEWQAFSNHFGERMLLFRLFRLLQVLGAYGFRGLTERKQHFIDSIPPALDSLQATLDAGAADKYPYLRHVLSQMLEKTQKTADTKENKHSEHSEPSAPRLHVHICSFSYKHGYPPDTTGHGGGYVFDCRGSNNPGRYAGYRNLSGLDKPVRDFIEHDGELLRFLAHVRALADAHVERYIERGFTDLSFAFGCTGGQHRSVYSAEHLAAHLRERYDIRVTVVHREQQHWHHD